MLTMTTRSRPTALVLLVAAAAAMAVCAERVGARDDDSYLVVPAKEYTIDLSVDPYYRWQHVAADYSGMAHLFEDYVRDFVHLTTEEAVLFEQLMGLLDFTFGKDLADELRGLADTIGVDLGVLVIINLGYELDPKNKTLGPSGLHNVETRVDDEIACSAVVMTDDTGRVFQGRNLDWNVPNSLRNLTIGCTFTNGTQYMFSGGCVVGYVGILTGMKAGQFAANLNSRLHGGGLFIDIVTHLLRGAKQPVTFLRKVMESAETYEDAVNQLSTGVVAAPVYFIASGIKEDQGIVITRNRTDSIRPWTLDVANNQWWLFETNYDHWLPAPPEDDRRDAGIRAINELGRINVNVDGVMEVLSVPLVRNNETMMTVIMCPITGYIKTYIVYNE